ncbi:MAG TPA: hypothetical protein VFS60_02450 [Thermoanaerobaculia bacterium]|nr:hypothetical protein [Thermoanaerobaculia bacterium]
MLLFRSEEHVDRWCTVRGLPRRPVVSLDQLWQLAVAWYSNRLTPEARRPMGAEVREIFQRIGLTDPFWDT